MAKWAMDVAGVFTPEDTQGIPEHFLKGSLRDVAEDVLAAIVAAWPVDTGTSLAGFGVRASGETWEVYNDVDYAEYVHDGLLQQTAEVALEAAKPKALELLAELKVRAAMEAGTRTQSRGKVADILAAASAPELTNIVATGTRLGLSSKIMTMLRAGQVLEAITVLGRTGHIPEARQLARLTA